MGEPRLDLVKVTNPALFTVPAIRELFVRSFASSSLVPAWDTTQEASLADLVRRGFMHVWVAFADAAPRGLLIIAAPEGPLYPHPQVYLVFSDGPKAVVKALAAAGVDFLRQKGYNHYWGLNGLTDNDAAYARMFRHAGQGRRVGSVMEFQIDG